MIVQMKAVEKYFPVVLLYKVVQSFVSADCDNSTKSQDAVLCSGVIYYTAQDGPSFGVSTEKS